MDKEEVVLKRFEAHTYHQELLYIYRFDGLYYLVTSSVDYNSYLASLDWKSGKIQPEEGETEIEYEGEVKTLHLPFDVVQVLAGDTIEWLLEVNKDLKYRLDPFPDDGWDEIS
ncbi:hypothetical protein D3C75_846740 [compost metagenome]